MNQSQINDLISYRNKGLTWKEITSKIKEYIPSLSYILSDFYFCNTFVKNVFARTVSI